MMAKSAASVSPASEDAKSPMSPMSPIVANNSTSTTQTASQVTSDKEYYSSSRCSLGMVDEWGIFLRDTEVAYEPSMAFIFFLRPI